MMQLVPYVGVAAAINGVAACREVFAPLTRSRSTFIGLQSEATSGGKNGFGTKR